jgi:hypothetical protein
VANCGPGADTGRSNPARLATSAPPISRAAVVGGLALTLGAALICGLAAHGIGRIGRLPWIDSAAVAIGTGRAVAWAVRRCVLPRPVLALLLAITGVTLAFTVDLVLDYLWVRGLIDSSAEELRRLLGDHGLQGASPPLLTPRAYLYHRLGLEREPALTELTVSAAVASTPLASLVELLGCTALAGMLARAPTRTPACAACGAFCTGELLGDALHGIGPALEEALRRGDPAAAAALLAPPDTPERVRLLLLRCPAGHHGAAGLLRLCERTIDRHGRARWHLRSDLPVDAAAVALLTGRRDQLAPGLTGEPAQ